MGAIRRWGREVTARAGRVGVLLTRLLVVNREGRLLRWRGKATLDSFGHGRHQRLVAEALPALLRLVNRHDRPTISRRPGNVKDLPLWEAPVTRMNGRDRGFVLLLCPSGKPMHNAVRHRAL